MIPLTDKSPMPFGKHKGVALEKVPAQYLLWLWDNGIHAEQGKPLHRYIKESFSELESEAKDYIVQNPVK